MGMLVQKESGEYGVVYALVSDQNSISAETQSPDIGIRIGSEEVVPVPPLQDGTILQRQRRRWDHFTFPRSNPFLNLIMLQLLRRQCG